MDLVPAGGIAYGDNLNFPYGAGPGACCGFDVHSGSWQMRLKQMRMDFLYQVATFNGAPHVSDQSASSLCG